MKLPSVRAKLSSQQGASILFALFFFIVCAVIGSIVLTAATAAAGRLAQAKERDERYYAVTSAVRLLEAQINDPATKVEREMVETKDSTSPTYKITGYDGAAMTTVDSVPQLMQKAVYEICKTDANKREPFSKTTGTYPSSDVNPLTLTIGHKDATGTIDKALSATAEFQMEQGGTVKIRVQDPKAKYTITMVCPAHVMTNVYVSEKDGTTTTKEVITWSVSAVVKGANS